MVRHKQETRVSVPFIFLENVYGSVRSVWELDKINIRDLS